MSSEPDAIPISSLGYEAARDELIQIVKKLDVTALDKVPYFSTLLVPPSRGETGGRI